MKRILLSLSILFLILIYGCAQTTNFSSQYANELKGTIDANHPNGQIYGAYDSSPASANSPAGANAPSCVIGKCVCMVCSNGSSFFGFFTSLVGGQCYFQQNCDQTAFNAIDSGKFVDPAGNPVPNLFPRQFMLGQGPNPNDFGTGNSYCSNRLSMSVQWLVGSNMTPYELPNAGQSVCLLDAGVMPLFILYSNSTNVNVTRSAEIAQNLQTQGNLYTTRLTGGSGNVGPTIITTEINFDSNNDTVVSQVVKQIDALYHGCQNSEPNVDGGAPVRHCLVALAPKVNDYSGLDKVMNAIGPNNNKISDEVDLVAYGIDYRFVRTCNPGTILWQAQNFSKYALYHYLKPTVIPYVLFDPSGSDFHSDSVPATCTWNEQFMRKAYSDIFANGVTSLPTLGVIGMAPYSLNSVKFGFNPLNCVDCDLGKNPERLASWYGGCQAYTTITNQISGTISKHPSPGTLLVFSNASGGYCDFNTQFDFLAKSNFFPGGDFTTTQAPPLDTAVKKLVSCDACITESSKIPFPFLSGLGSSFSATSPECTLFPEVETWASARGIDASLLRAVIKRESSFDQCLATKVCSAGYKSRGGSGCLNLPSTSGNDFCYDKGFDSMSDPTGRCPDSNYPTPTTDPNTGNPDWRYCSMGLVQINTPPYTFWPGAVNYPVLQRSMNNKWDPRFDLAQPCNPSTFNPFSVSDNLCSATLELQQALANARKYVHDNHNLLAWDSGTPDGIEKDNVFTAYVALNMYTNYWNTIVSGSDTAFDKDHLCNPGDRLSDCWMQNYYISWSHGTDFCDKHQDDTTYCDSNHNPKQGYGVTDPIEYIDTYFIASGKDGAAKELADYYQLRNNCASSNCPSWKNIYTSETPAEQSKNPLPPNGNPFAPG